MKVLIVSGFLGAGKTTFIKELIRKSKKDLVIMENEYGEVGIDGDILREEASGLSASSSPLPKKPDIRELTEGCICCSGKSDFASSVLTISNSLDPEYLIVEPTGVGMLSNVINNILQISYEHISLLSPVAIVDAYSFDRYMREYREIFSDQIRSAGQVIFSKADPSYESEKERLYSEVRKLNASCKILFEHYSSMGEEWWEALLSTALSGERIKSLPSSPPSLNSFSLGNIQLSSPVEAIMLMEDIIRGNYGNICRSKGTIMAGDELLRYDVASESHSITAADTGTENTSKAVFIGKDINKNELRKLLLKDYKRQTKIRPGF